MPENTPPKSPLKAPWQPGQSGNPAGRPKGSLNKFGEDFKSALQEHFREHGPDAIHRVWKDEPTQYLKVIATVTPKELNIKHDAFDGVSDEQIAALVAAARSALGIAEGGGEEVRATAH